MSDLEKFADKLKAMNSQDFTHAISGLPTNLMLELAISRSGITAFRGDSMWDPNMTIQHEEINYLELAKLLKGLKN